MFFSISSLQNSAVNDPSCSIATSFRMSTVTVAALNSVTSATHSNRSHSLSLAVTEEPKRSVTAEYVANGQEGTFLLHHNEPYRKSLIFRTIHNNYTGRRHQFLFIPVNFSQLTSIVDSEETLQLIYNPFIRYIRFCPGVVAERERRMKNRLDSGNLLLPLFS